MKKPYKKPMEIRWRIRFDSTDEELQRFFVNFYGKDYEFTAKEKVAYSDITAYLIIHLASTCYGIDKATEEFISQNFHFDKNAKYIDKVMYARRCKDIEGNPAYEQDYYLEDSAGNTVYLQKGIKSVMEKNDESNTKYSYLYTLDIEEHCGINDDRMQTIVDGNIIYDFRYPEDYGHNEEGYALHKNGLLPAEIPPHKNKPDAPVLLTQEMLEKNKEET